MSKFSEQFKALRLSRNLTQPEVARRMGISRSAVSMYESGAREPNLETLQKIAEIFSVDSNTLTGDETPRPLSDRDLKQALFGDAGADDRLLDDVRAYAAFRYGRKDC